MGRLDEAKEKRIKHYCYNLWEPAFLSSPFLIMAMVSLASFFKHGGKESLLESVAYGLGSMIMITVCSRCIVTTDEEIGVFLGGFCSGKWRWEDVLATYTEKDGMGNYRTFFELAPSEDIVNLKIPRAVFKKRGLMVNSAFDGYFDLLEEIKIKAINAKLDDTANSLLETRKLPIINFTSFSKFGFIVIMILFLWYVYSLF